MTIPQPEWTGDLIKDGLALVQYHSIGLDQLGEINLARLRRIQSGYEAALETVERAKQGHTPAPQITPPTNDDDSKGQS